MTAVRKSASKPSANPIKNAMIGKVHVAKSQLALADDNYRAILERITGKTSSKACSVSELEAVLTEFKRLGWVPKKSPPKRAAAKRPLADSAVADKARALWISLYHLGVVRNPAEGALEEFLKRQSGGKVLGLPKLQWMKAADAEKVIEGLKAMAARSVAKGGGGVDWSGFHDRAGTLIGYNPRRRVVEAQAAILGRTLRDIEAGAYAITGKAGFAWYGETDWDRLIEALGPSVRAARGG